MYDEIYEILVPYGTYLQQGEIAHSHRGFFIVKEGREKGEPVEVVLAIITGVAIGSFLESFFEELGKVAAQKALEKITSNMKSASKFDRSRLNEIETFIKEIKSDIRDVPPDDLKKYILQAKKEVEKELESEGLPKYKSETISLKISSVLQARIIKKDQ